MVFNCAYTKLVDIDSIVPNPRNANEHPDRQIELLAKIIKHQGQRSPLVVSNRSGFLTKGHGRLAAMKLLGWNQVAVDFQDYESEAQEFADMISDNKIAELARHDDNKMLDGIKELEIDDFELLGLDDFQFDFGQLADLENEATPQESEKKYLIEVQFPNDMEMAQVYDDLLSRGYIVKKK